MNSNLKDQYVRKYQHLEQNKWINRSKGRGGINSLIQWSIWAYISLKLVKLLYQCWGTRQNTSRYEEHPKVLNKMFSCTWISFKLHVSKLHIIPWCILFILFCHHLCYKITHQGSNNQYKDTSVKTFPIFSSYLKQNKMKWDIANVWWKMFYL